MIGSTLLAKLTYSGLFLLLAGSGALVPVPEEVTLLTVGYLCAIGVMNSEKAIAIAICGLLIGDTILFSLAKFGAQYARKVHDRLIEAGLDKTWVFSPSNPLRAVFLLRFVTGIRVISPIFAGFNGASWIGFWATDIAALLLFVPSLVWLGSHFHEHFVSFLAAFEIVRHAVFWTIIAVVGGSVLATMSPRLHRIIHHVRRKKGEHE